MKAHNTEIFKFEKNVTTLEEVINNVCKPYIHQQVTGYTEEVNIYIDTKTDEDNYIITFKWDKEIPDYTKYNYVID